MPEGPGIPGLLLCGQGQVLVIKGAVAVDIHPHGRGLHRQDIGAGQPVGGKVLLHVGLVLGGQGGHLVAQQVDVDVRAALAHAVEPDDQGVLAAVAVRALGGPGRPGEGDILALLVVLHGVLHPAGGLGHLPIRRRGGVGAQVAALVGGAAHAEGLAGGHGHGEVHLLRPCVDVLLHIIGKRAGLAGLHRHLDGQVLARALGLIAVLVGAVHIFHGALGGAKRHLKGIAGKTAHVLGKFQYDLRNRGAPFIALDDDVRLGQGDLRGRRRAGAFLRRGRRSRRRGSRLGASAHHAKEQKCCKQERDLFLH